MNGKKNQLISVLMSLLDEEDKSMCQQIIDCLVELGYVPRKQKVQGYVLSFKHNQNNKTIAKIGVRDGNNPKAFIAIKFFACKSAPEKYHDALRREIESHNGQYCGPLRSNTEKSKCGYCSSCTGGGLGYYYMYPDGNEVLRCGAYPITIPDLTPNDIDTLKEIVLEQHNYFLSLD
jgi:hypothetical protein